MIYLTKHETTAAYNAVKDNLAKPHVALIEETNKVDYQPTTPPTPTAETRVIAIFNVEDTSESINVGGSNYLYSSMEIDGVEQPSVSKYYTFSTTGEHTVKYTLIDSTSIGDYAFGDCQYLTSIYIPNSVTSIGANAFYQCTGLTSIVIPSGVTSIGMVAFELCRGLTSIDIPSGVTIINEHTFNGCDGLTTCTIGSGVTSIAYGAFSGCYSLTSINIPDSVTNIENDAFCECDSLIDSAIIAAIEAINPNALYCTP